MLIMKSFNCEAFANTPMSLESVSGPFRVRTGSAPTTESDLSSCEHRLFLILKMIDNAFYNLESCRSPPRLCHAFWCACAPCIRYLSDLSAITFVTSSLIKVHPTVLRSRASDGEGGGSQLLLRLIWASINLFLLLLPSVLYCPCVKCIGDRVSKYAWKSQKFSNHIITRLRQTPSALYKLLGVNSCHALFYVRDFYDPIRSICIIELKADLRQSCHSPVTFVH
ncbi:hypothetical protein B0F90DRAFT_731424 [Multifurca ochricompacta]|uniref:Uncharacterized protein n=1 Tax=Multifurca ochricompacta TaxID=376703 RepID=A0AAD4M9Y1_9AGAM|nr:hypothetical protein B0F90DRAFT_731424 [Multifurca ochricompacta]